MNELIKSEQEVVIPPITDDTLIGLADQAEKRVDALNRIKRAALKATNARDWTDQNGNPYLQVSGAEKVGRVFGVSWRIDEPVMEKEESGHFAYTYKGYFSLAGAEIEAIGTRSSKDGFFKRYSGRGDERKELPPSEIDKGDVKKSAYTNCIGNGVTRILGIRNLTWEDLQEFANISKEQVSSIDYKKNGKTQSAIKSADAETVTVGIADVRLLAGKTNGKAWSKYIIKNGNAEYTTFSKTFAEKAKEAMAAGLQCEITFTTNQFGKNLEALKVVEPFERTPGQEG